MCKYSEFDAKFKQMCRILHKISIDLGEFPGDSLKQKKALISECLFLCIILTEYRTVVFIHSVDQSVTIDV